MFDTTPYFQDGRHDVRLRSLLHMHGRLGMVYAAASAGFPQACRARVTSVLCCICYTSWSHVYL